VLVLSCLVASTCQKVPIADINASFLLADVTWFEQEKTLFVFYRVNAEQGLSSTSQIEVSYQTDTAIQPWVALDSLTKVHTHQAIDCGPKQLCGSTSVAVDLEPRQVRMRLRYDKQGETFLDSSVALNIVKARAPAQRSLVVYGVFDANNERIQWRGRHQFPTLRNQEVTALGLLRWFKVSTPSFGEVAQTMANPYSYGLLRACGSTLIPLGWPDIETTDRAIFDTHVMPLTASTATGVCASSTVIDATGTFQATVAALKNPQTRDAFPLLHNPIRRNAPIGVVVRPCESEFSAEHLELQTQRLLLEQPDVVCSDNWMNPNFTTNVVSILRTRINQRREAQNDMVIALAFHHDEPTGALAAKIEEALRTVLSFERDKGSPRVSGAFVFDTFGYAVKNADLRKLVLWCPAKISPDDLDTITSASARGCPILPDVPDLVVGPVKLSSLPILPTQKQYSTFVQKYTAANVGKMLSLDYLAPERTPLSRNIAVGEFGIATFFNEERITAAPMDAFSFCAAGDEKASFVVFSVAGVETAFPLSALPMIHARAAQSSYALGLVWDSPMLIRGTYRSFLAGAATPFSFTLPFGFASTNTSYFGNKLWESENISLGRSLQQCTRFCGLPTFDSAGVYQVTQPFSSTYANQCYQPKFPVLGDGGFPIDP
jgi:hypothetical protein